MSNQTLTPVRKQWAVVVLSWAGLLLAGCIPGEKELHYLGSGEDPGQYYVTESKHITEAHVHEPHPDSVRETLPPPTLWDRKHYKVRDISLEEAIETALRNSAIIRNSAEFLSPANPILANSDLVPSIYDPAIQETGFLFFGRGLESALAAFDAQFSTSMFWGRNEQPMNSILFPGATLTQETGAFTASLSKVFATGGSL